MQHLLCRQDTWYFYRRVPINLREFDSRKFVRISLKTDSKTQAAKLAVFQNEKLEHYWQQLCATGRKHSHDYFAQVVNRAQILGFSYTPVNQLADGCINEIADRVLYIVNQKFNTNQAEAVLGGADEPDIKLDDLLPKFWDITNHVKIEKSEYQYKKWQSPRKLAIQNLINCVGNKSVKQLTRQDCLLLRDWWIERIQKEEVGPGTADKHFFYLKGIISTVSDNYKLAIDTTHLFNKLAFDEDYEPRPPFTTGHIVNVLLNPINLKGMDDVYQNMLKVFAETGVHLDEQLGVLPEDIFLSHEIPHVVIQSRQKDKLKTKYRKRVMPLVGFALEAFRKYPHGFSALVSNADKASSAIGKYLRENKLLPTEKHSTYSLRHSFQDRLTNLDCPDRLQTELMGHQFDRTKYGEGPTLGHKYEWMKKIQLKNTKRQ